MTREIVVGVDGSEQAATALRFALEEAAPDDAAVVAVLVWDLLDQVHADGGRRIDPDYDDQHADAALRAAIEAAVGPEVAASVGRRTVCDIASRGLLEAARDADLLVVGTRGVGGFRGLVMGSVSQQCLHHAEVPIAVVPATGEPADRAATGRIVVGVDGSDGARGALRWALADGARRQAVVEVVHAWDLPVIYGPVIGASPYDDTEDAARRMLDAVVDEAVATAGTVTVERTLVVGGPAAGLLDAAKGADLVVVGRRGLGGFGRLLLGSVSENVARHAPCPVVVMTPEADRTD